MRNVETTQKFFEVTAKCGHVGKNKFYKGVFFVSATDGSAAAANVRKMPRVKHHHKDAILSVVEIGYDEFRAGQAQSRLNPYFNCTNKQAQQLFLSDIADNIHDETCFNERKRNDGADRQAKLEVMRRYFRKMDKHGCCSKGA